MWRSHRKLMGPSMLPPFLGRMAPRISHRVFELIDLWEAKYETSRTLFKNGAAFEADPDIHLLMMVSLCQCFLDVKRLNPNPGHH